MNNFKSMRYRVVDYEFFRTKFTKNVSTKILLSPLDHKKTVFKVKFASSYSSLLVDTRLKDFRIVKITRYLRNKVFHTQEEKTIDVLQFFF